jgi:hypothetical protein
LTYEYRIVFEALLESFENNAFMLPFDDTGDRGEHSERVLSLLRLGGLAKLEKGTKELGPLVICRREEQCQQSS